MKTARVRQSFWLSVKWRFNTPFLQFSLFFCTTPPISCFLPPALQVPLSGVVKKSCVFPKKNLGKILSVRGIVVPLHSLSEKNPGAGLRKGVFRVRMKKRSLTYCKQQQGSSRPFPSGSLGDSKETRYVDFIYNRIQWIPIERRCLGQRTDRFLFQLSDPHTLLYNIYRDSEPKIQF